MNDIDQREMIDILTSRKFITIYVMIFCNQMYFCFFDQTFKEYGELYIDDDEWLTYIGAVSAMANGFSKILLGCLMDFVPFKSIYPFILLLIFIHVTTLHLAVREIWSYFAASVTSLCCEGAMASLTPTLLL